MSRRFEGFDSYFTGGLREREEYVMKDGEVVKPSERWSIFTIQARGRSFRVAFQEVVPGSGKEAPDLNKVVEAVEQLAALVGNNEPLEE